MRRWGSLFLCVGFGLLATGCPKGQPDFNQGKKAETIQDYDAAFRLLPKAVKKEPYNASYKIKLNSIRFEASEKHVKAGLELRKKGDLQGAASEFERAQVIDPFQPGGGPGVAQDGRNDRGEKPRGGRGGGAAG